jgi:hypothetical protein
MAGIFPADAVLKTSIELGLADLRANPWLIDYMMSDFTQNQYLAKKFGIKQVDSLKEWIANNQIDIVMGYNPDTMRLPCVSILIGPQSEKVELKTMGDISTERVKLLPNQIGKPIPYILAPTQPLDYESETGEVEFPDTVDLINVVPGQILVNPSNGKGYIIQNVIGNSVMIETGQTIATDLLGIVPHKAFYEARVEHTFMNAHYTVVCSAHGDPQTAIWLHDIILFCLFRYRESLLEALGLSESIISSGDLAIDSDIPMQGPEYAWSRPITITGQIEQFFVKSPKRFIENVAFIENLCEGYIGGISIISNESTPEEARENQTWYTDTIQEVDAKSKRRKRRK